MADPIASVEIPNRPLFKASEVCELVKVQPYVLRSWEAEFPELGVSKSAGGPRVYRRGDVEQVLRIKHLLLVEGLTLAGARRKMEDAQPAVLDEPAPPVRDTVGADVRQRIVAVKDGLRSLLALLNPARGAEPEGRAREFELSAVDSPVLTRVASGPRKPAKASRSPQPKRSS